MTTAEIRDPYTLRTDNGQTVNVRTASPNKTIVIHGHRIKVKDIVITAAQLDCGHFLRGIAFQEGDLVHCDKHEDLNHESHVITVTR